MVSLCGGPAPPPCPAAAPPAEELVEAGRGVGVLTPRPGTHSNALTGHTGGTFSTKVIRAFH